MVIETLQQQAGAEDLDAVWVAALPSQTVGIDPHLFQLDVADGAWREVVLVAGGEGVGTTTEPVKPLLRPANYRADLTFRFRFLNLIRGVNSVNHRYIGGDLNTGLRLYQGLVLDMVQLL